MTAQAGQVMSQADQGWQAGRADERVGRSGARAGGAATVWAGGRAGMNFHGVLSAGSLDSDIINETLPHADC